MKREDMKTIGSVRRKLTLQKGILLKKKWFLRDKKV